MTTVEGQHHQYQQHQHAAAAAAAAANLYDPKAFKNYAAMSAMCWPGFDPASSYSTAAYTQTAAFAAAANSLTCSSASVAKSEPSTPAATLSSVLSSQSFGFPAHSTTPSTPPSKKKAMPVPVEQKDQTYWERRHRNNESARRSREARRHKEEAVSIRVIYLENENMQLRTEVGMLRQEIEKLRSLMVYSSAHHAVHH